MIIIPAIFPFGLRIRHLRILSPAVFSTLLIVGGVLLLSSPAGHAQCPGLESRRRKNHRRRYARHLSRSRKGKVEYRSFLTSDIEYVKDDEEEHQCKVKTPDNYIIFETRYFDSEEEFEAFRSLLG